MGVAGLLATVVFGIAGLLPYFYSPPPIERVEKFPVMIPFDTDGFPIPIDENPDDPLSMTYKELHSLV